MRIGLVVDNPYRDLPGMVLLARELALGGAQCYLIPYNLRDVEVWPIAPDFLLLNFLRTINEDWTAKLTQANIRFGVLDTEGSVFSPVPAWAMEDLAAADHIIDKNKEEIIDYLVTVARKPEVRRASSCYLAWSQNVKEFLVSSQLYTADQITVTGSPRTDMLTPEFRPAARSISSYADDYAKPIVLINASFPTANPAFLTAEQEIDLMVKAFKYNRKFCEDSVRTQTIALRGVTKMANELARHFPHVTFILRPHPFESTNVYKFLLDDLPNLKLIKQGTVDGWLLRASALIQIGSSTAVEASVIGVPVFTPGWLPLHVAVPVSTLASVSADTIDQMKGYLENVMAGSYQVTEEKRRKIDQAIVQAYGTMDGRSHQRASAEILRHCINNNPRRTIRHCRQQFFSSLISGSKWRKRIHTAINLMTNRGIHWSWTKLKNDYKKKLPWDQSDKHFDAQQVQSILDALESVLPQSEKKIKALQAGKTDYHFSYREGRSVIVETRPK